MSETLDDSFYMTVSSSQHNASIAENDSEPSTSASHKSLNQTATTKKNVVIVDCYDTAETLPYKALEYHWFYTSTVLDKTNWLPMSYKDSKKLENAYLNNIETIKELRATSAINIPKHLIVLVKGGRFECNLVDLIERPIYWKEKNVERVRRCLWFYKESNEQIYVPYEEEYSLFLEKEYERSIRTNIFHKRIDFKPVGNTSFVASNQNADTTNQVGDDEAFVFHSTSIMQHFQQASMLDEFGNVSSDAKRPRIMKRGINEVVDKIEPDEIDEIDELCFVVHGIGEGCDIKFRPIVECVDDFRDMSSYIIQSHFKPHIESKKINGRIEFLPISWHDELHGDTTGIDERLKPITLSSIPKLRQYSNSTILDVLFYTSPIYCQTIISKVGGELNRLYKMFIERNPNFKGRISLAGHSLGSLIIFDILSHQHKNEDDDSCSMRSKLFEKNYESLEEFLSILKLSEYKNLFEKEQITLDSMHLLNETDLEKLGIPLGPRRILQEAFNKSTFKKEREDLAIKINNNLQTFKMQELSKLNPVDAKETTDDYFKYGLAGTGQLLIKYPQLCFNVKNFFALGSPIAMFMTVRGVERLGCNFKLPTCENFFNIFHPFDPVAYRIEPLVCTGKLVPPVLLPHHKGRKRLHLELKENFTKVSDEIKQRMLEQITKAWSSLTEFTKIPIAAGSTEPAESIQMSESKATMHVETKEPANVLTQQMNINDNDDDDEADAMSEKSSDLEKIDWGLLNKGRRIDYVLQERPIESFNEYIFAIASHACYWESEDTILLMTKEIYEINNDSNLSSDDLKQESSWLDANVKKTFSYFNLAIPQSLTSVLNATATASACSSVLQASAPTTTPASKSASNQPIKEPIQEIEMTKVVQKQDRK